MCLLERRAQNVTPLDMMLTSSYAQSQSCLPRYACVNVGVPASYRSTKAYSLCNTCHQDIHLTITQVCMCRTPRSPQPQVSPYLSSHQFFPSWSEQQKMLDDTVRALRISGWYYEQSLTWQGAKALLKEASIGAFLLRNSADKNFLFSLSVQTERGPTSVRLYYEYGYFRLDCDKSVSKYMPRFRGVVELIQHYAMENQKPAMGTMWVDMHGCTHSKVDLRNPLRRKPPSLRHLSRLAIHKALDSNPLTPKLRNAPKHRLLTLPNSLLQYLDEYPYSV